MALATYADLLSKIQEYNDDTSTVVTAVAADMVTLAEGRIYNGFGSLGAALYSPPLRVPAIEARKVLKVSPGSDGGTSGGTGDVQTVTVSGLSSVVYGTTITFKAGLSNTGAMTINPNGLGASSVKKGKRLVDLSAGDVMADGYYTVYFDGSQFVLMPSDGAVPLPTGWLGSKSAYIQNRGVQLFEAPGSGIDGWMNGQPAGMPTYYAVEGGSLRFDPFPDQTYNVAMTYYKRPSALSVELNDVFADAPNIYLYAALLEFSLYNPDEHAEKWHANFVAACEGYSRSNKRTSIGYSPTRVRFKVAP